MLSMGCSTGGGTLTKMAVMKEVLSVPFHLTYFMLPLLKGLLRNSVSCSFVPLHCLYLASLFLCNRQFFVPNLPCRLLFVTFF